MNDRSVVVDLQALQSPDHRGRGIAKYALELALALEARDPGVVSRYLLNPDLPPPGDLGALIGTGKVGYDEIPVGARLLHVLSPFELAVPINAVWPGWAHERGFRVCATVYDLIPLEHPDVYLRDPGQRTLYSARLELLRAADALLTISPATSRSLIARLGVPEQRCHMVGAGTAPRFAPASSEETARDIALESVPGLEPHFVLYPAGSDGRKNVEALVRAFALLPEPLRRTHQLVLTGDMPGPMVNHLEHMAASGGVADRVLCTGYVPDDTMLRLYQTTDLVCFPSLFEGYGLPAAEALACGAVTIVSDVDSLRDLVAPECRFDPESPAAIAAAVERALTDGELRTRAVANAARSRMGWDQVADRTRAAYETLLGASRPSAGRRARPRLAVVSPFPPIASGIADYSFRIVEQLQATGAFDIDCFADGLDRGPGPAVVPSGLDCYDARGFRAVEGVTAGYDKVLYVLGNGEFHSSALESLRRRSGVVLAHEVRLSGLYRFAARSKAAVPGGLAAAVRRMYGSLLPKDLASSGEVTPVEAERYGLLMAREVISLAERFLVTSEAAAELARIEAGQELASRVGVAGFAIGAPAKDARHRSAERTPGRLLTSFGIVDPAKQPEKLLRAFARMAEGRPALRFAFVGPVSTSLADELLVLASRLGVADRVQVAGRVGPDVYSEWLDRADLALQLRAGFGGEASAAVADCLAHGVPMVVSDTGWMAELPAEVARKVAPTVTDAELAELCLALLDDADARGSLSERALAYAREHSFAAAAQTLVDLLSADALS